MKSSSPLSILILYMHLSVLTLLLLARINLFAWLERSPGCLNIFPLPFLRFSDIIGLHSPVFHLWWAFFLKFVQNYSSYVTCTSWHLHPVFQRCQNNARPLTLSMFLPVFKNSASHYWSIHTLYCLLCLLKSAYIYLFKALLRPGLWPACGSSIKIEFYGFILDFLYSLTVYH